MNLEPIFQMINKLPRINCISSSPVGEYSRNVVVELEDHESNEILNRMRPLNIDVPFTEDVIVEDSLLRNAWTEQWTSAKDLRHQDVVHAMIKFDKEQKLIYEMGYSDNKITFFVRTEDYYYEARYNLQHKERTLRETQGSKKIPFKEARELWSHLIMDGWEKV